MRLVEFHALNDDINDTRIGTTYDLQESHAPSRGLRRRVAEKRYLHVEVEWHENIC